MKFELALDPHRLRATPRAPGRPVERGGITLRLDIGERRGADGAGVEQGEVSNRVRHGDHDRGGEGERGADRSGIGNGNGRDRDRDRDRDLAPPAERPRSAAAWRAASRHAVQPGGAPPPVVSGAVPVLRTVVAPAVSPRAAATASGATRWFEATLSRRRTLVVPPGVHLVGDFRAHTVHVEGRVDGCVVATGGPLIVAEGACVTGSVEGRRDVVIAGRVVAHGARPAVKAGGHLHLGGTSRVVGTVSHRGVSVYEGAVVGAQPSADAE